MKNSNAWVPIPSEKLFTYLDIEFKANTFCDVCNTFLDDLKMIPYAYDNKNNDVYFITRCPYCGDIMYFKE